MKSLQTTGTMRFDMREMEVPIIKQETDIIPVSVRLKLDVYPDDTHN